MARREAESPTRPRAADEGPSGSDDGVTAVVEAPPAAALAQARPPLLTRGSLLGRYVILEPLGEGGMGIVYAAYDSQLDRRVALKLLLPGSEQGPQDTGPSSEGHARLLREAQAMARLAHPNVVAVFDAGSFEGQVFMAMELVEGVTLRQWEREAPRTWRQVVDVFLAAGRGLAAAHAARLVHRDFKPANVLVGSDGRVRVTDFGLARATPAEGEDTLTGSGPLAPEELAAVPTDGTGRLLDSQLTHAGLVLGTPRYMAPEQFRGQPGDARSDQFSFCVALWEALYGGLPFEGETPAERRRNVLEGRLRPAPPGTRVPSRLHRLLVRGLQTPPGARFVSMEALLEELARRPEEARRRALAVGVGLVLGVGGSLLATAGWGSRSATLCTGAERKLAGLWDAPRQARLRQHLLATGEPSAPDVWRTVHQALTPYTQRWVAMHQDTCEATRVRGEQTEEVLSLRMACLEGRLHEVAALVDVLAEADGAVLKRAGPLVGGLSRLEGCADVEALLSQVKPPQDEPTRRAVEALRPRLARVKVLTQAGRFRDAISLAADVVGASRPLGYKPFLAEALYAQGWARIISSQNQQAIESLEEATWLAQASRHDSVAAAASARLIRAFGSQGQYDKAAYWDRFVESAIERLGGDDDLRATFLNNSAGNLLDMGRYAEAAERYRQAWELDRRVHGPGHIYTLHSQANLALALDGMGQHEESSRVLEEALRLGEKHLEPDNPYVRVTALFLVPNYLMQGRYREARARLEQIEAIAQNALPEKSTKRGTFYRQWGELEASEGHLDKALRYYEQSLETFQDAVGPDSPRSLFGQLYVGEVLLRQGRLEEARRRYQPVLEEAAKEPERNYALYASALRHMGELHSARGLHAQALQAHQQALEVVRKHLGEAHFDAALGQVHVAEVLLAQGEPRQALSLHEVAQDIIEKSVGPRAPHMARVLRGRGEALLALSRASEALPLLERAREVAEAYPGWPELQARARFALARAVQEKHGDTARAVSLASAALEAYGRLPPHHAPEAAQVRRWLRRPALALTRP